MASPSLTSGSASCFNAFGLFAMDGVNCRGQGLHAINPHAVPKMSNRARFQNYINLCLTNKFRTLHSKSIKDALSQPGNVSLDTQRECGDPFSVSDEFCHSHSEHLQRVANASERRGQDRALITEFVDFVRREDANSVAGIESLLVGGTQEEAARSLGMTEAQFNRTRNRLVQLGRCFLTGEPAPKQRKPYRVRTKREAVLDLTTAA